MGGITGFSSLADGMQRLDVTGIGFSIVYISIVYIYYSSHYLIYIIIVCTKILRSKDITLPMHAT